MRERANKEPYTHIWWLINKTIANQELLPSHHNATSVNNPIYPNNFCTSTLPPSSPANFLRSTEH
jgi:hypothetical protein